MRRKKLYRFCDKIRLFYLGIVASDNFGRKIDKTKKKKNLIEAERTRTEDTVGPNMLTIGYVRYLLLIQSFPCNLCSSGYLWVAKI